MPSLSQQEKDALKLIERSKDVGDGWKKCSPALYRIAVIPLPDELVEKQPDPPMVRLTEEGKIVLKWLF